MFQLMSPKWFLTVVCIIGGLTGRDAHGQIGGWNGGYYPGNGFTPINGTFGGNPVGGFGNYGFGIGYSNGFGGGFGNPYGFYGGISPFNYAQPIYSTFNQPNYSYFQTPIYSTRLYAPSIYVPPVINQPIYVPSVSPQSTYVSSPNRQQADSNLIDLRRIQIATAPKVNPAPPQATFDNGQIVIFSPPTNTKDVQYALNSATYTMKPGTLQKFTNDRVWTIETNLNGQTVKYNLSAGRYKFSQYGSVMNLYTTKENPESPAPPPSIPSPPAPASDTPAPSQMPVD